MTVRSSTRGLPGLPRGRCGLSAFQASSDSQNKLFAMTIALQRLKSSANISSKSTSCMGSLPCKSDARSLPRLAPSTLRGPFV
jgi:hypothetical protein